MRALQNIKTHKEELCSLYFDGRKDRPMKIEKKGTRWYRSKTAEEAISLIEEPGSTYIGHITPASGTAENVKNEILTFPRES